MVQPLDDETPTLAPAPEREAWRERRLPPVQDLGGGVWSIPVPVPNSPLRYTLVYLLDSDAGPVLVDTGWDDPSGRTALAEGMAAAGFDLADLHGVLITHHHPDHHGLSAHVRAESGAWIAMHAAETTLVRALREVPSSRWLGRMARLLADQGTPPEYLDQLRSLGSDRPPRESDPLVGALPDRSLEDGADAGVPGRNLRVVHTPGHTPGHVCLYLDERLNGRHHPRLLSGDHLLPTISPAISLYPEHPDAEPTDPLGDYLDSLERVSRLDVAEVLPAHQYRFADAPARARDLVRHHQERLAELHSQLKQAPLTLWEVAAGMGWNRPWDELDFVSRNLALAEAAAHLRRLVNTGLVEPGRDGSTVRYRTA